jgi:hypothetical protein
VIEVEAVVFDLDDTLIVEEATARAAMAEALSIVDALGARAGVQVAIDTARRHWRSSEHHRLCVDLGIASWEGLWATFDGGHPCLGGLGEWAPTYRLAAWGHTLAILGADPGLAQLVADRYSLDG